MHLTSEHIRAARALLRWEQAKLSEVSGIPLSTVKRLEMRPGPLASQAKTVAALESALEAAGIRFSAEAGIGVHLRAA